VDAHLGYWFSTYSHLLALLSILPVGISPDHPFWHYSSYFYLLTLLSLVATSTSPTSTCWLFSLSYLKYWPLLVLLPTNTLLTGTYQHFSHFYLLALFPLLSKVLALLVLLPTNTPFNGTYQHFSHFYLLALLSLLLSLLSTGTSSVFSNETHPTPINSLLYELALLPI
jgi:hypothetical protein